MTAILRSHDSATRRTGEGNPPRKGLVEKAVQPEQAASRVVGRLGAGHRSAVFSVFEVLRDALCRSHLGRGRDGVLGTPPTPHAQPVAPRRGARLDGVRVRQTNWGRALEVVPASRHVASRGSTGLLHATLRFIFSDAGTPRRCPWREYGPSSSRPNRWRRNTADRRRRAPPAATDAAVVMKQAVGVSRDPHSVEADHEAAPAGSKTSGALERGDHQCAGCGYRLLVVRPLPYCPMCGSSAEGPTRIKRAGPLRRRVLLAHKTGPDE